MKKLRLNESERNLVHQTLESTLKSTDIFNNTLKVTLPEDTVKPILPHVYITNDAYAKMIALVDASDVEIGWHGIVEREENNYTITDILMFPQVNSSTRSTSKQEDYANWITEQMLLDMDMFKKIRMQGHSHVNMEVFSSGTDDQYQNDMIRNIEDGDYYIFLIANKKRKVAIYLYDFTQQYLFTTKDDNIRLELILDQPEGYSEWAKEQIKEYCSMPTLIKARNTRYPQYTEDIWIDELSEAYKKRSLKHKKKGKK